MKLNNFIRLTTLTVLFAFIGSCTRVPITGRKQVNIIPKSQLYPMSFTQYGDFMKNAKVSNNVQQTQMIKNVGNKIKNAVEQYMKEKKLTKRLKDYSWEFNLIEDPNVNAWCMPGGKVVFYTGILPITQNETGVAVVMGHEVAHAIAEHGGERMSQGLIQQMGGVALSVAMSEKSEQTRNLWMAAYGAGSQVGVMLPFSRMHESEADKLGLIFMAIAGYNPNEAIAFWERMAKLKGGNQPEFLSTHPSDKTRIDDLKEYMPEAMKYYKK